MGSSPLNDTDIGRISLKSSYSCRMEIMPYISKIPAMHGWNSQGHKAMSTA